MQGSLSSLHTPTPMKTGDGMAAIGKSLGFTATATTTILGCEEEVWRMTSRDAPRKGSSHGAHHKSENPDQDHDPEQVQDLDPDQDQGREAKEGSNDLI